MSQVLIDSNSLTAIGDAIRSKNKKIVKYKPNEMAGAIRALALDNSVTIQSNDAWKYAIDSTLEHQSITVKVFGRLTGDNTTGYKGEVIFDPYITTNFGWLAGKIKQTIDNTNHIITFSTEAATEISGVLQDGWTPVYVVDDKYYTTTTPDNISSLKSVSSFDNIENLLICGYYNLDKSTNKLVAIKPTKIIGPVSNNTKKYQNKYIKTIGSYAFDSCSSLTTVDVSNATTIGDSAFDFCSSLTTVDVSNATTIGRIAFRNCYSLTTVDVSNATTIDSSAFSDAYLLQYLVINNSTARKTNYRLSSKCKILVPSAAIEAYKSLNSTMSNFFDAIENYTITKEKGKVIVTKKG